MKAGNMKSLCRSLGISLALLVCTLAQASDRTLIATSGYTRVELIELYTSESCSSCPPADRWFSDLKNSATLWKRFVPVAFHVDYWNQLGWKDNFSSEEMTKRQVDVARLWGGGSGVYTPGMVLNAKEWKEWRELTPQQIPASAEASKFSITLYRLPSGDVAVKVDGLHGDHPYVLKTAKLGMGLSSTVSSGENSGKLLRHDFVVLDWKQKTVNEKQAEAVFHFKDLSHKASHFAIAAWLEEVGNPTPIQAVGSYL
jgi:hypothetical protein